MKILYDRFFKQFLLLLCINQMASGLFRLIGALGRNMIVANSFGSFALLAILVLGGFILSRGELLITLKEQVPSTSRLFVRDTDGKNIAFFFCIRGCTEMVVMGLLGLPNDVWAERYSGQ